MGVQVADKAMQWTPYSYSDKVVKRNDPNKKRRWLIPVVLAAQIAFKVRSKAEATIRCHSSQLCTDDALHPLPAPLQGRRLFTPHWSHQARRS